MKLKYKTDFTISKHCQFSIGHLRELLTLIKNLSAGGAIQGAQDMKQCAFSGSRDSGYRYCFAIMNVQVEPTQNMNHPACHRVGLLDSAS